MKNYLLLLLVFILTADNAVGQQYQTDENAKEKITKLAFLVGEWEGKGWSMGRDGQKHHFAQTENVSFKLDSTAILIEGRGSTNGNIIHDALAVISSKKEEENYIFKSWLSNGRGGEFKAEILDSKFYWYPNENMRYIISLNKKGQWHETGQMKQGEEWFQFFEMTLDKK